MKRCFTKLCLLLALAVGIGALLPRTGWTQHPRDVSGLLQRLDRELQTAEHALSVVPNRTLRHELEKARRLRSEANAALEARRYDVAEAKAKQALRLLDDIRARLLGGPVQKIVQRYQDLLRQAELLVPGSGDKEAERLLNDAKKSARQAKKLASRGEFEKSAARYREAIFLLQTCLKKVKKRTRVQDQVRAARQRLETLRERLGPAAQNGSQNPGTRTLIQQAQEETRQGASAEASKRWNAALQHYNRAIRLLYRVLDQGGAPAEQTLRELDRLLRSRTEALPPGRAGRLLLQKAERLRNEAWRALQNGRPGIAAKKAMLARRLLEASGVAGAAGRQNRAETVWRELDRYRAALARLRRRVSGDDLASKHLLGEATRQAQLAQKSLREGRPRLASRHLLVGYRLLELVRTGAPQEQTDAAGLRREIRELEFQIQRVVDRRGERPFVKSALHLLGRADRELQGGNVRAAAGLVNAAKALLNSVETAGKP